MDKQEPMYKVKCVFGDIETVAASFDRDSAVMTAVGMAWSEHTLKELERGYITNMPMICSFNSEDDLLRFITEMSEQDDGFDDPWLSYTVEEILL